MAKYNGLTFTPIRTLTEEEKNMSLAQIDKHFGYEWDMELGMFDRESVHGNPQKYPYSHESFYASMKEDGWADIFLCEENGKYYIPCLHTMMKINSDKA